MRKEYNKPASYIEVRLKDWQLNGEAWLLIIGGADGWSTECKQKCHQLWGLSGTHIDSLPWRGFLVIEQLFSWTHHLDQPPLS
jgi:23S rRNA pseudoU1915 N3-methylase RlmH